MMRRLRMIAAATLTLGLLSATTTTSVASAAPLDQWCTAIQVTSDVINRSDYQYGEMKASDITQGVNVCVNRYGQIASIGSVSFNVNNVTFTVSVEQQSAGSPPPIGSRGGTITNSAVYFGRWFPMGIMTRYAQQYTSEVRVGLTSTGLPYACLGWVSATPISGVTTRLSNTAFTCREGAPSPNGVHYTTPAGTVNQGYNSVGLNLHRNAGANCDQKSLGSTVNTNYAFGATSFTVTPTGVSDGSPWLWTSGTITGTWTNGYWKIVANISGYDRSNPAQQITCSHTTVPQYR